jgi:hypothetical protein
MHKSCLNTILASYLGPLNTEKRAGPTHRAVEFGFSPPLTQTVETLPNV